MKAFIIAISVIVALIIGIALGAGIFAIGMFGIAGCQTADCADAAWPVAIGLAVDSLLAPMTLLLLIIILRSHKKPTVLSVLGVGVLATILGIFIPTLIWIGSVVFGGKLPFPLTSIPALMLFSTVIVVTLFLILHFRKGRASPAAEVSLAEFGIIQNELKPKSH